MMIKMMRCITKMVLTVKIFDNRTGSCETKIAVLLIERPITPEELESYIRNQYRVTSEKIDITTNQRAITACMINFDDFVHAYIAESSDSEVASDVIHNIDTTIKLGEKKDGDFSLTPYEAIFKMNARNNSYCISGELQSLAKTGNKIVTLTIYNVKYHVEARVINGYLLPPL